MSSFHSTRASPLRPNIQKASESFYFTQPQQQKINSLHLRVKIESLPKHKQLQKYNPANIYRNRILDEELVKEQNFINNLKAPEEEFQPKNNFKVYGEKAIQKYYQSYKQLDRILEQKVLFNLPDSSTLSMLKMIQSKKLAPLKLGIVKQQGNKEKLKIANMNYGDKYADIIAVGLQNNKDIIKYELQNNRVSETSSPFLIKQVTRNAEKINLSNNLIGKLGCDKLAEALQQRYCKIEYLNLTNNKLGDKALKNLLEIIRINKSLKVLDISNNLLSDESSLPISEIIKDCPLYELYLHWNQFKSASGKLIFQALQENDELKVLDLSCNCLGNEGTCAQEIGEFLIKNKEMKHLDLSFNYFTKSDCQIISQTLEQNKTIYGFHFAGNIGYVDSRGFLILDATNNYEQQLTGTFNKGRIRGMKMQGYELFRNNRDIQIQDCCWICQGWQEMQFTYTQGESGTFDENEPLFINFNFEDFNPNYFGKQDNTYIYNRMVPPGDLYYFFTINKTQTQVAQNHNQRQFTDGKLIKKIKNFDDTYRDEQLNELNYNYVKKNPDLFTHNYNVNVYIQPRSRDPIYIPAQAIKYKKKWTFPISLMSKWKPDDEDLIKKCFVFDWEYGKMTKLLKKDDERQQVYDFFLQRYKKIKDTYKYYASQNPIGEVWCIQKQPFNEFIQAIRIIDGNLIKDSDIDIKWVATVSGSEKGNSRNPERGINRYQFMEVLLRIAEEKYILKQKSTANYFEAICSFWNEHLENEISQHDSQIWRNIRYWNEECDYCLKYYKAVLDYIYKKNSFKRVKPGQAAFMCLEELQDICTQAGLVNDPNFGSSVPYFAYNLAMQTQIDEMSQDRIFQMNIFEFYEAITRIAEDASLPNYFQNQNEENNDSFENRKQYKLSTKLESLIIRLLQCCTDAAFKQNFQGSRKIENSCFVQKQLDEQGYVFID